MIGRFLQGKTALVTGGSRGIGAATVLALAEAGANVAVHYNNRTELAEQIAATARTEGVKAQPFQANFMEEAKVEQLVTEVLAAFGQVDILVNNAGIILDEPVTVLTREALIGTLAVNLIAPLLLTKSLISGMRKRKWGRIINIVSMVGQCGGRGQVSYSATKGGLIAASKSTAREVASRGITVNCVSPGFIDTDMMKSVGPVMLEEIRKLCPLGRFGTPKEVASTVLFLAGDNAAFCTGQVLGVNGGLLI